MNLIFLAGRATKDAELRYTATGKPVMSLVVATNEIRGGGDTKKEYSEYTRVSAFGSYVERLAPLIKKGSPVFVQGSITHRDWTNKQGINQIVTEVSAKTVKLTMNVGRGTTDAELQQEHVQQSNDRMPY